MNVKFNFKKVTDFVERLSDKHVYETHLMTATQKIAKVLHQLLLEKTPVDTGNLRKMWSAGDNLLFTVERVSGGFEVTLINAAENKRGMSDTSQPGYMYGNAVNYGHVSPAGGWVMGRFFVERSIAETELQVQKLIYQELQKWFRWCVNGK